MNSISLTSYDIKSGDYERLHQFLIKNEFAIVESNSEIVIKDRRYARYNYGVIFRRKVILLDDRSIKDPEFEAKSASLKDLLDEF